MVTDLADFISTWPSRQDLITAQIEEIQDAIGVQDPDVALLFDQLADSIGELGGQLAGSAGAIASGAFGVIGTLFLVVLLALFMVLDSHRIMVWLSRLVPSRFRDQSILFQEGRGAARSGASSAPRPSSPWSCSPWSCSWAWLPGRWAGWSTSSWPRSCPVS